MAINWGAAANGLSEMRRRIDAENQAASQARKAAAGALAQGKAASSQIWGSTVEKVANIAADTYTHVQTSKAQAATKAEEMRQKDADTWSKMSPAERKAQGAVVQGGNKQFVRTELTDMKAQTAELNALRESGSISNRKYQEKMAKINGQQEQLKIVQEGYKQAEQYMADYGDGIQKMSPANSPDKTGLYNAISTGDATVELNKETGDYELKGTVNGKDISMPVKDFAQVGEVIKPTDNLATLTKDTLNAINKKIEVRGENGEIMRGHQFENELVQQELETGLKTLKADLGTDGIKDRLAAEGAKELAEPPAGVDPAQWESMPLHEKLGVLERVPGENGQNALAERFDQMATREVKTAYGIDDLMTHKTADEIEGQGLRNDATRQQMDLARKKDAREATKLGLQLNNAAARAGESKASEKQYNDAQLAFSRAAVSGEDGETVVNWDKLQGTKIDGKTSIGSVVETQNGYALTMIVGGEEKKITMNADNQQGAEEAAYHYLQNNLFSVDPRDAGRMARTHGDEATFDSNEDQYNRQAENYNIPNL